MHEDAHEHDMLHDVSEVAGVESVPIIHSRVGSSGKLFTFSERNRGKLPIITATDASELRLRMFTSLKSLSMFLALAYSSGAPVFDGVRPGPLDVPLRSFHQDVQLAARNGVAFIRDLASTETARSAVEGNPATKLIRQIGRDLTPTSAAR